MSRLAGKHVYNSRRWVRMRGAIINREPLCRLCGRPAKEVDHLIPLRMGGADTAANLQPLCRTCHGRKTSGERAAAAAVAVADDRRRPVIRV